MFAIPMRTGIVRCSDNLYWFARMAIIRVGAATVDQYDANNDWDFQGIVFDDNNFIKSSLVEAEATTPVDFDLQSSVDRPLRAHIEMDKPSLSPTGNGRFGLVVTFTGIGSGGTPPYKVTVAFGNGRAGVSQGVPENFRITPPAEVMNGPGRVYPYCDVEDSNHVLDCVNTFLDTHELPHAVATVGTPTLNASRHHIEVDVDGRTSVDPDNVAVPPGIRSWDWTGQNGTGTMVQASGDHLHLSIPYSGPDAQGRNAVITLTVTDDEGTQNTATEVIH